MVCWFTSTLSGTSPARSRFRTSVCAPVTAAPGLPQPASVLRHEILPSIAASSAAYRLFQGIYLAMLVHSLRRDVGAGAATIGAVLSIAAVGGVAGAMVASRVSAWLGHGRAIWMSLALTAPFTILLPASDAGWRLWLGTTGAAIAAGGVIIYNVAQVSLRQVVTPDPLLGRMNAPIQFLVWAITPVGALLGAMLGRSLGPRPAVLIGSVGTCLAFIPVAVSPVRKAG